MSEIDDLIAEVRKMVDEVKQMQDELRECFAIVCELERAVKKAGGVDAPAKPTPPSIKLVKYGFFKTTVRKAGGE